MLTISIANIPVDLASTSLSVVLTSPYPMMAAGQQGGNYIFNFKVPATPALKKAYSHAHRPAAMAGRVELPYYINAAGIKYRGMAQLSEASNDFYEVFCPLATGDFNSRAKDMRLPELDYGGGVSLPIPAVVAKTQHNIYFDLFEPVFFTHTEFVPFANKIANATELNQNGTIYTADSAKVVAVQFDINCQFYASSSQLQILLNNVVVKSFYLQHGSQQLIHNLSLALDDQVSWQLHFEALAGEEYSITGTLFADSKLTIAKQQAQSSLRDAATNRYPDINYAVFPLHNPYAFDKWPDDEFSVDNQSLKNIYSNFIRVINYWYDNDFPETMTVTGLEGEEFTAGNLFVPFPYIAFIMHRIADRFGFRIVNNVFDDELKYAVLINHFLENRFIDETILEANDTLNLNDHVPDWSVYDFIQNVCKLFALGYEVDNESSTITFTYVKDLLTTTDVIDISHLVVSKPRADWQGHPDAFRLQQKYPSECKLSGDIKPTTGLNIKGAVADIGALPATGDVNDAYLVILYDSYYVWNYDPDSYVFKWIFHSRRYTSEIESGNDAVEISTELPGALSINYFDAIQPIATNRKWLIPASHQAAQFEGAPDIYQGEWKPLVVWYHGLKNDSLGNPYPFASADMVDYAGSEIAGVPFSLQLGGTRGTYNLLWKNYLQWRTTAKPVRVNIIPDRAFLRSFRFNKKVRFGGANYLVAEMRGNIGRLGPDVFELLLLVV